MRLQQMKLLFEKEYGVHGLGSWWASANFPVNLKQATASWRKRGFVLGLVSSTMIKCSPF